MVVEHQVHESRENSVVRVLYSRCRIEANSGDRIHLEDSVARVGAVVSGGRKSKFWGMVSLYSFLRTVSSAWPSKLESRQIPREEAR